VSHRSATTVAAVNVLWGATAKAQGPTPGPSPAPDTGSASGAAPSTPAPVPAEPAPPPGEPKGVAPGTPVALASTPAQAMMTMKGWKATFYGFVEFDGIYDTTQSFGDGVGNTPVMRTDGSYPAELTIGTQLLGVSYASQHPRTILTPRNTTFGFRVEPPEIASVKTAAVIEFDFFGNQPTNPYTQTGGNSPTTESSYLSSAAPRMRHAYVDMKTPIIDLMAGQNYHLFGWQPLFFPATDSFLGVPNMVFDRRAQIRLTKRIETKPVNILLAAAATRSAQADSGMPDATGGLLFQINGWKGAHMLGPSQPKWDPLSVGVSGIYRQFRVAQFINNQGSPQTAAQDAISEGYGISIDALIPVIPVKNPEDRSNGLTITGSFVTGTGIGDLYTGGLTGGANFPQPLSTVGAFEGTYTPNIDPGVAQYAIKIDPNTGMPLPDPNGNWIGILRTLNLQTYMIGLQYYLPFLQGRFVLSGNYTHMSMNNVQQWGQAPPTAFAGLSSAAFNPGFEAEKAAGGDPTRNFHEATYYDANLFMGITDSFKVGLSWQHVEQVFLASLPKGAALSADPVMQDSKEHNDRFEISTFFYF
jgi:hypothetical protein